MKITFTMSDPDPKKHSTKFSFQKIEEVNGEKLQDPKVVAEVSKVSWFKSFKPQFYVPAPFMDAEVLRITIEKVK